MNILIVDDVEEKASNIESIIYSSLPAGEVKFSRARSFVEATKCLREHTYDLLILDLMLPIQVDSMPVNTGGMNVLNEILKGMDCRPPTHIICLTAFEAVAKQMQAIASLHLVHVIVYDETKSDWSRALISKSQHIFKRIKDEIAHAQDVDEVDIVIVTSSPKVELNAVLTLEGFDSPEYSQKDEVYYYLSKWTTKSGRELSVVACAAPVMGMTAASVTALKAIQRWRPKYLVMNGIAAGTKRKEQNFGDILVADTAYDYGSGKISQDEDGNSTFIPSPFQLAIDAELHAILRKWERDAAWIKKITDAWEISNPPQKKAPKMDIGVFATGAAVVQNKDIVDDILSNSRKVIGLDMEAYSIFQAARLAGKFKPKVFVAKSVSDFADSKKRDFWQKYSAFTSARFTYEFFTSNEELYTSGKAN